MKTEECRTVEGEPERAEETRKTKGLKDTLHSSKKRIDELDETGRQSGDKGVELGIDWWA